MNLTSWLQENHYNTYIHKEAESELGIYEAV